MKLATLKQRLFRMLRIGTGQNTETKSRPPDVASIEFTGKAGDPHAERLQQARIRLASSEVELPDWIRKMKGMSGQKYRLLINELVRTTPDACYLEVGSWIGSTACSAIFGNNLKALCIDNWSEFGGPKETFFSNIAKCQTSDVEFDFMEADCLEVDYSKLGPFNIFFYDGPHSEEDTYKCITASQEALAPVYTLIVDDWNWGYVRRGTCRALQDLGVEIIAELSIRTTQDGSYPRVYEHRSDWHNGYYFAVCRR